MSDTIEIRKHMHGNKPELDVLSDGDHDVRGDNPHNVTPEQLGVYTETEVDNLVIDGGNF